MVEYLLTLKKLTYMLPVLTIAVVAPVALTGCESDNDAEEVGEKIDEAADDVKDATKDAADDVKDAAEDASDDVKDAVDN